MSIGKLLDQHPIAGFVTGAASFGSSFIETATPYIQFIAAVFGAGVLIITFAIKLRHWRRGKD